MLDPTESYTSTGKKILRHLDVLKTFQESGAITPISLQVAPTSRCNLKCCFCSNVNRQQHEDLSFWDLTHFIDNLYLLGNLKTIEWTGGGDPTQYTNIRSILKYSAKIQQGFITNGVDLVKSLGDSIDYLTWIRISLNSLDYVKDIDIPMNYKGTLGFSYVMNEKTDSEIISKVKRYAEKYKPKYVRIVPNCQISSEELVKTNEHFSKLVKEWGSPFFYQSKTFSQPKRCWWGHFKPFLLHDGFVYPCSSVVLNDTSERSFHKKFRWMSMKEFCVAMEKKAIPFDSKDCSNCVFGEQNELVESLISSKMEDFL